MPTSSVAALIPLGNPRVTALVDAPKALEDMPVTVPLVIVRPPVKLLAPERVKVPRPTLVMLRAPVVLLMLPAKLKVVFPFPSDRLAAVDERSSTVPLPRREFTVWVNPLRLNVPLTVRVPAVGPLGSWKLWPSARVLPE